MLTAPFHTQDKLAVKIAFSALFAAVSLLIVLLSNIIPSGIWPFIALVYYVFFCLMLAKQFPEAFILLLWFIFLRLTTLLSGLAIENGAFMIEILQTGEVSGAFARLTLLYTVVILVGILVINFLLKFIPREPSEKQKQFFTYWILPLWGLTFLFCIAMVILGLKTGFPLLTGTDRMVYRDEEGGRLFGFFLTNRNMFALLLGLTVIQIKNWQRTISFGLFVFIFILSILFAEKFTSLSSMMIYFVTPYFLLLQKARDTMAGKLAVLAVIISFITIPMVLINYGAAESGSDAMERLKTRAASQAQVWYLADKEVDDWFRLDTLRLEHNFASMKTLAPYSVSAQYPYIGVGDFMAEYMPLDRYVAYTEGGVSLTMGAEGYLLKIFGWIGMVPPYIILLSVYCAHLVYLAYGIRTLNPIRMMMAAKLLVWSGYGLNQGQFWFVIGVKSVIFMALVIAVEVLLAFAKKRYIQTDTSKASANITTKTI